MAGGYPCAWLLCETLYFVGLSMLLGCIGVRDLRMLPWAVAGFAINTITGVPYWASASVH